MQKTANKTSSLERLLSRFEPDIVLVYQGITGTPADVVRHLQEHPHAPKFDRPFYDTNRISDHLVVYELDEQGHVEAIMTEMPPDSGSVHFMSDHDMRGRS
jgi:hypothetical protein